MTRLESVRERASLLAMYQAEVKDPGYAPKDLARYRTATKEGIKDVAAQYLAADKRVVIRVVPKKKPEAAKKDEKGAKK